MNNTDLILHIYTGSDGTFTLYEDDGKSEKYRTKNELRQTVLHITTKKKK